MKLKQQVSIEFREKYKAPPAYIVRAPGRVNLIGEHTDYNDGFVLPMAIDRAMWIALRPRADRRVVVHSLDFPKPADFSLDKIIHGKGWEEYVRGVAWALQLADYSLQGWEGILASDIPLGAGLASSAALEMSLAKAFSLMSTWSFDPEEMAQIGQNVENKWVGARTGIMDQLICIAGKEGHALLIDCRDLSSKLVPLPPDTAVVVMDTSTRRSHADSGYNLRRMQCEAAARYFGVSHLRDVSIATFNLHSTDMDELHRRRARHVIIENERVIQAGIKMSNGDAVNMGQLMNASHLSMRDDFEITNDELNTIVRIAQNQSGCYGARLTGGGFGGCAVAMVERNAASQFAEAVAAEYELQTRIKPKIYICQATNGVEVIEL